MPGRVHLIPVSASLRDKKSVRGPASKNGSAVPPGRECARALTRIELLMSGNLQETIDGLRRSCQIASSWTLHRIVDAAVASCVRRTCAAMIQELHFILEPRQSQQSSDRTTRDGAAATPASNEPRRSGMAPVRKAQAG